MKIIKGRNKKSNKWLLTVKPENFDVLMAQIAYFRKNIQYFSVINDLDINGEESQFIILIQFYLFYERKDVRDFFKYCLIECIVNGLDDVNCYFYKLIKQQESSEFERLEKFVKEQND